jgi:phosphate transport system permease protein
LAILFVSIASKGYTAFWQTFLELEVYFDPQVFKQGDLKTADYPGLVKKSLRRFFPEVKGRTDKRALYRIVSNGASFKLRRMVLTDPSIVGKSLPVWVPADDDVDMLTKGFLGSGKDRGKGRLSTKQIEWIDHLRKDGKLKKQFNTGFFTSGDSREPELAGIGGATVGSFLTLILTLILSFPIGVAAAVYLEEFAPKNRWTDLIEVNINNLAAVPSIVFGLLGLAVFLNFFGLPRSAPLAGGLVLTLMTLPTIIIASRASLQSVPPSIREAALGVGASKMQMVAHHVFPLALPGMLTGTIIGMARALGESAPLLMIGMVAFIVDIPDGFTDPATVLPVQIFLWADSPERAFVERTSAATMALLAFLIIMNLGAVLLRKRFERRW